MTTANASRFSAFSDICVYEQAKTALCKDTFNIVLQYYYKGDRDYEDEKNEKLKDHIRQLKMNNKIFKYLPYITRETSYDGINLLYTRIDDIMSMIWRITEDTDDNKNELLIKSKGEYKNINVYELEKLLKKVMKDGYYNNRFCYVVYHIDASGHWEKVNIRVRIKSMSQQKYNYDYWDGSDVGYNCHKYILYDNTNDSRYAPKYTYDGGLSAVTKKEYIVNKYGYEWYFIYTIENSHRRDSEDDEPETDSDSDDE